MFPILQIGPLAIQLPGLLLLLGVWLGTLMSERVARQNQISASAVSNMIFYALIGGILGARLGYVLRFLELYLQSPLGIIALNPNTLSPLEGVVVALLVALIFGQRKELPLWKTLDVLTPGLAVFIIFIGLTHLASGDAFGAETTLPWGINLWGARRHPTQIYEILAACIVLYLILRFNTSPRFDGFLLLAFSAMTAFSRFTIDAFRGDSMIVLGNIHSAQLMSLILLVGSLILLHIRARKSTSHEQPA
jgi:phosphatidylglycerol:prolipoprotein diacylglycerol transferase